MTDTERGELVRREPIGNKPFAEQLDAQIAETSTECFDNTFHKVAKQMTRDQWNAAFKAGYLAAMEREPTVYEALTAQQAGEPVAVVKPYGFVVEREAGSTLFFRENPILKIPDADCWTKDHRIVEVYTAPPSGVREGMLRAAEICKKPKPECCGRFVSDDHSLNPVCCGNFEPSEYMDGLECAEAITRAAEQINAEGRESGKPVKAADNTATGGIRSPAPSAPPSAPQTVRVPKDDDVMWILGQPCFAIGGFADFLRKGGMDIPRKAESEQAEVAYYCLQMYAKHGADWRKEVGKAMDAMLRAAQESGQ